MQVQFNSGGQLALNVLLGFLMFGVALDMRIADLFKSFRHPRPVLAGLLAQLVALPLVTLALVHLAAPPATVALGLFLVAACPGGNVSNYISAMAKADVGLSVTLTTFTTLWCFILTPLGFNFWASLYGPTASGLREFQIDQFQMIRTVLLLLVLPISLAIGLRHFFPDLIERYKKPVQMVGGVLFVLFVVAAVASNWQVLSAGAGRLFGYVVVHNALAFGAGIAVATVFRLNRSEVSTVSIETGIQNSGLGLVLALDFFPGQMEMALIAAMWGVWHLIAGSAMAGIFRWTSSINN